MNLVYGVGVNDSLTPVVRRVQGKQISCPHYVTWYNMLKRCYDHKLHAKQPTYKGCTVVQEWLKFSNFRAWMQAQDWQGKPLDKDLLVQGNKLYGPETCVFVSQALNNLMTTHGAAKGDYPVGVYWHKQHSKFKASCSNHLTRKQEHLGYFVTPEEAHLAWRARKHEHALAHATYESDPRIVQALQTRYI